MEPSVSCSVTVLSVAKATTSFHGIVHSVPIAWVKVSVFWSLFLIVPVSTSPLLSRSSSAATGAAAKTSRAATSGSARFTSARWQAIVGLVDLAQQTE